MKVSTIVVLGVEIARLHLQVSKKCPRENDLGALPTPMIPISQLCRCPGLSSDQFVSHRCHLSLLAGQKVRHRKNLQSARRTELLTATTVRRLQSKRSPQWIARRRSKSFGRGSRACLTAKVSLQTTLVVVI